MFKIEKTKIKILSIFLLVSINMNYFYGTSYANPIKIQIQNNLLIPPKYGKIVESFVGDSEEEYIIIQDLHCNLKVQEDIYKMIKEIKNLNKKNLKVIGVEGSYERIDTSILNFIKNKEQKTKIVKYLFKKGYITGAEYYKIFEKENVDLIGLEEKEMYEENLEILYETFKNKKSLNYIFKKTEKNLEEMGEYVYNDITKKFKEEGNKYKKGILGLEKYIKILDNYDKNLKINKLRTKDNINKIITLEEKRLSIDLYELKWETEVLLKQISNRFRKKEIEILQRYKNDEYYYLYLQTILKKNNINITRNYKTISDYIEYLKMANDVNEIDLINEIETIQYEIEQELLKKNEEAQNLLLCKKYIEIYKRYLLNDANEKEVIEFKSQKNIYKKQLIENLYRFDRFFSEKEEELRKIEKNMNRFYELADKRSDILINNIVKIKKGKTKVIVVGGYHTNRIKENLKVRGLSYKILTPRVDKKIANNIYEKRILEQGNLKRNKKLDISIESNIEKNKILPPSIFKLQINQNIDSPEKVLNVLLERYMTKSEINEFRAKMDKDLNLSIVNTSFINVLKNISSPAKIFHVFSPISLIISRISILFYPRSTLSNMASLIGDNVDIQNESISEESIDLPTFWEYFYNDKKIKSIQFLKLNKTYSNKILAKGYYEGTSNKLIIYISSRLFQIITELKQKNETFTIFYSLVNAILLHEIKELEFINIHKVQNAHEQSLKTNQRNSDIILFLNQLNKNDSETKIDNDVKSIVEFYDNSILHSFSREFLKIFYDIEQNTKNKNNKYLINNRYLINLQNIYYLILSMGENFTNSIKNEHKLLYSQLEMIVDIPFSSKVLDTNYFIKYNKVKIELEKVIKYLLAHNEIFLEIAEKMFEYSSECEYDDFFARYKYLNIANNKFENIKKYVEILFNSNDNPNQKLLGAQADLKELLNDLNKEYKLLINKKEEEKGYIYFADILFANDIDELKKAILNRLEQNTKKRYGKKRNEMREAVLPVTFEGNEVLYRGIRVKREIIEKIFNVGEQGNPNYNFLDYALNPMAYTKLGAKPFGENNHYPESIAGTTQLTIFRTHALTFLYEGNEGYELKDSNNILIIKPKKNQEIQLTTISFIGAIYEGEIDLWEVYSHEIFCAITVENKGNGTIKKILYNPNYVKREVEYDINDIEVNKVFTSLIRGTEMFKNNQEKEMTNDTKVGKFFNKLFIMPLINFYKNIDYYKIFASLVEHKLQKEIKYFFNSSIVKDIIKLNVNQNTNIEDIKRNSDGIFKFLTDGWKPQKEYEHNGRFVLYNIYILYKKLLKEIFNSINNYENAMQHANEYILSFFGSKSVTNISSTEINSVYTDIFLQTYNENKILTYMGYGIQKPSGSSTEIGIKFIKDAYFYLSLQKKEKYREFNLNNFNIIVPQAETKKELNFKDSLDFLAEFVMDFYNNIRMPIDRDISFYNITEQNKNRNNDYQNRGHHDSRHIFRVYKMILELCQIFNLKKEEVFYAVIFGLFHDSCRRGINEDFWDHESAALATEFLVGLGIPINKLVHIRDSVTDKKSVYLKESISIADVIAMIIDIADSIDIIRIEKKVWYDTKVIQNFNKILTFINKEGDVEIINNMCVFLFKYILFIFHTNFTYDRDESGILGPVKFSFDEKGYFKEFQSITFYLIWDLLTDNIPHQNVTFKEIQKIYEDHGNSKKVKRLLIDFKNCLKTKESFDNLLRSNHFYNILDDQSDTSTLYPVTNYLNTLDVSSDINNVDKAQNEQLEIYKKNQEILYNNDFVNLKAVITIVSFMMTGLATHRVLFRLTNVKRYIEFVRVTKREIILPLSSSIQVYKKILDLKTTKTLIKLLFPLNRSIIISLQQIEDKDKKKKHKVLVEEVAEGAFSGVVRHLNTYPSYINKNHKSKFAKFIIKTKKEINNKIKIDGKAIKLKIVKNRNNKNETKIIGLEANMMIDGNLEVIMTKKLAKILKYMKKLLGKSKYNILIDEIMKHEKIELENIRLGKSQEEAHEIALKKSGKFQEIFYNIILKLNEFEKKNNLENNYITIEYLQKFIDTIKDYLNQFDIDKEITQKEIFKMNKKIKKIMINLLPEVSIIRKEVVIYMNEIKNKGLKTRLIELGLLNGEKLKEGFRVLLAGHLLDENIMEIIESLETMDNLYWVGGEKTLETMKADHRIKNL
ncbi:MAG: hypothetical protein LBF97_04575, partial [Elusimicrobiota bacterium]|nr:hypothetical protein [Elusimicrobiota bacterium]